MKYSVTSVILPELDVAETCRLLQELGYDGVEWRVRYTPEAAVGKGYGFWGEHKSDLSPSNLAARAEEVLRITIEHGLAVPAIAANLRADELDDLRRLADGVARMGRVPVRVGAPRGYDRTASYPELLGQAVEAYARAIDALAPYELPILVEIHGGTIMVSASLAFRLVSHFPPSRIGVIYDVNNMAHDGFETFRIGMEVLGDYLQHCHAGGWRPVESGRRPDGSLDWKLEGCDLSEGILNVPQFLGDLAAVGYDGFVSIEDFRAMDPREKLRRQIEFLKRVEPKS